MPFLRDRRCRERWLRLASASGVACCGISLRFDDRVVDMTRKSDRVAARVRILQPLEREFLFQYSAQRLFGQKGLADQLGLTRIAACPQVGVPDPLKQCLG